MKTKSISYVLATALLTTYAAPSLVFAQNVLRSDSQLSNSTASAGITESERMAMQIIIASSLAENQGADLARIDREVAKKYETMRNVYFGSVPTSLVGGAFSGYFGPTALKTSAIFGGPLVASLKPMLLYSWEGVKASGTSIDNLFKALKIDVLFEASSNTVESSYKAVIEPILKLLVNKNTSVASGSSASAGVLFASYKFYTNDSQDAMSYASLRNLLGQNEAVRSRVDSLVTSIAPVLNLDASAQSKLKILVYDSILSQAIQNQFSSDSSKYTLDIPQLLASNGLLAADMLEAIKKVQVISNSIKLDGQIKKPAKEIILQNVDITLSLAAALESNINSGKIQDPKTLAHLQRMLGALSANLALVGFNFKK